MMRAFILTIVTVVIVSSGTNAASTSVASAGLAATCSNAPTPGELTCSPSGLYQCRLKEHLTTLSNAAACETFYDGDTKCPDGPISWRGFLSYGIGEPGNPSYWDLCYSWAWIANFPQKTIHGRDGVSSKATVAHSSRMSAGAGILIHKRMKCDDTECKVYKSGLCIDISGYAGLPEGKQRTPFAYLGRYDTDYSHNGWSQAVDYDEAITLFAAGAEALLKDVQGSDIPVKGLPDAYKCSNTVDTTWNEAYGSDAAQAKKAIALF